MTLFRARLRAPLAGQPVPAIEQTRALVVIVASVTLAGAHGPEKHTAGERVVVPASDADWLVEAGFAVPVVEEERV